MLDLHDILERYAWSHFKDLEDIKRIKSEFRGLEKEDVEFEINMKRLVIQHGEPDYCNLTPSSAKPYTLFKTVFTNNTDRQQEYSFRTERSTESVCLIYREQGFTIGQEVEIGLKTPCEVLEFKAGFKHEMSFAKGTENSVSEMLTWAIDSAVVVPARYQTTAELVVEEMQYAGSFVLVSRLSGRVTVTIVRRKDGAIVTSITGHIAEIFRQLMDDRINGKDLKALATIDRTEVRLTTKGQCSFQFAMKQKVVLNEEPVRDNPATITQSLFNQFHQKK